jgi:hypothetical protein
VLPHEPRAGTPKQPSEDKRHQDRVVELARHRDEVRNEVEGHREVDEREPGCELPARGDARVAEEALEQDGAVWNGTGDHADVPLPGADREDGDQGRVEAEENDGNDKQPAHVAGHPRGTLR